MTHADMREYLWALDCFFLSGVRLVYLAVTISKTLPEIKSGKSKRTGVRASLSSFTSVALEVAPF
jgi:hypothetical protein